MASISYCTVAIAPVRAASSDKAEIVTQLLFGELLEIIGSDQQWLHIRTYMDNYEGWIDCKQVRPLTQKEMHRWLDGLTIEGSLTRKLETPWGNQVITRGAFVPFGEVKGFSIGNDHFTFLDAADAPPETVIDLQAVPTKFKVDLEVMPQEVRDMLARQANGLKEALKARAQA